MNKTDVITPLTTDLDRGTMIKGITPLSIEVQNIDTHITLPHPSCCMHNSAHQCIDDYDLFHCAQPH